MLFAPGRAVGVEDGAAFEAGADVFYRVMRVGAAKGEGVGR